VIELREDLHLLEKPPHVARTCRKVGQDHIHDPADPWVLDDLPRDAHPAAGDLAHEQPLRPGDVDALHELESLSRHQSFFFALIVPGGCSSGLRILRGFRLRLQSTGKRRELLEFEN
jgi:hypothetical protein